MVSCLIGDWASLQDSNFDSPGLIVFEVSRSFVVNSYKDM